MPAVKELCELLAAQSKALAALETSSSQQRSGRSGFSWTSLFWRRHANVRTAVDHSDVKRQLNSLFVVVNNLARAEDTLPTVHKDEWLSMTREMAPMSVRFRSEPEAAVHLRELLKLLRTRVEAVLEMNTSRVEHGESKSAMDVSSERADSKSMDSAIPMSLDTEPGNPLSLDVDLPAPFSLNLDSDPIVTDPCPLSMDNPYL